MDEALAREDRAAAAVDERAVRGRLGALRVADDRLVRGYEAIVDRGEGHRLGALDVRDAGQLERLEAAGVVLRERDDLRERALLAQVRRRLLHGLLGRERRLRRQRVVAVDRARGGDHVPAAGVLDADRHEAAARGVEAADLLAQRDGMAGVAGQLGVAHELEAVGRAEAEQRLVVFQPCACGRRRRRAGHAGCERAARIDQRRRRPELIPGDARAERPGAGALVARGVELALAHVAVGQPVRVVRRVARSQRRSPGHEYAGTDGQCRQRGTLTTICFPSREKSPAARVPQPGSARIHDRTERRCQAGCPD